MTLAASLLGDLPWYFAGRRYGYRILRTLCRIAIEPDSCVNQTETIFERWGAPSLLVAKYVPGFATVAPPLAGAMGVSLPRFIVFSAAGALLWAIVPVVAGMVFSAQVEQALGSVVSLFGYLSDKDVFAEVYRNLLAKRMLTAASASNDMERKMLSLLKTKF